MDGLDEFEKQLAADKAQRDKQRDREDDRRHKHRHRHHKDGHRHDPSRESGHHDDHHRHKRRRRSRSAERSQPSHGRHDYMRTRDAHKDYPAPDDEKPPSQDAVDNSKSLVRDAWMTAPSAIEVDFIHRKKQNNSPPPGPPKPQRVLHHRELNRDLGEVDIVDAERGFQREHETNDNRPFSVKNVDYSFGDRGSAWRMTKLKSIYSAANESGKAVEDIAIEKYGSLEDFDIAREEKEEMERRRIYGDGLQLKEKPTGDLYRQRMATSQHDTTVTEPEQGTVIPEDPNPPPSLDQSALNRLRAQMMKAKLRKAPNASQLEDEYNRAAKSFSQQSSPVILGTMDSRHLTGTRNEVVAVNTKRGRERGQVQENHDMTIEDMVREERRTKHQGGGEGMRMAERIAKDGKFDNDLEYMDENAEKLAKRVHKSEMNLKNMAVSEFQKMNRILENCPLCHHEEKGAGPIAPVVSLGTRSYLTLPTEPEVSPGGAMIVPTTHRQNLLECDDDEWEEIRNFMKSLTRMYHDQGREVLFYENAAHPHRHPHAAMTVVPIPYSEGATAPAYFREAFLSSDEEWSQHKKVIDTQKLATDAGQGRMAFRNAIAKEMPYFHVWFGLDGGLGHVVEDGGRWPKGDLFAREVVAGIVDCVDPSIVKKQGRWERGRGGSRVDSWRKSWRRFDWTRVLSE